MEEFLFACNHTFSHTLSLNLKILCVYTGEMAQACEFRYKSTLLPFVSKQTFDGWRSKTSRNTKQNTSDAVADTFCTYLPTVLF